MTEKFRTHEDGASIIVDDDERAVLVHFFSQLAEFLSPVDPGDADEPEAAPDPLAAMVGIGEDAEAPEDPALARLLPNAYPDDDEASREFRRLTQDGLRARKLTSTIAVLESLHGESHRLVLDSTQCQQWLTSLADLRLVLASRLGVTDDPDTQEWDEDAAPEDPRAAMLSIYDWLGYLQESLVRVLEKRLSAH